ncbi:MAG: hypothetical protein OXI17_07620 [Gammaproteobacteria bacterium]|nr:hypothetical protein [Gammaproteobacteria bacterium]
MGYTLTRFNDLMSQMTPPVHTFSLSRPLPGESASACWERLVEFERWPSWNPGLRKANCTPAGESGRGSVLAVETNSGRKLVWSIAHWEPQVKIAFIVRNRFFQSAWCFEFPADSAPGERRLKLEMELQCKPGAGLLLWWLRWSLRRRANRFLDCLCSE